MHKWLYTFTEPLVLPSCHTPLFEKRISLVGFAIARPGLAIARPDLDK